MYYIHSATTLLLMMLMQYTRCEPQVYILAENLEQVVTSTTLQWVSTNGQDKDLLENAVVGAYQSMEDQSDSEDSMNSVSSKQVYICRAKLNSIWVPGQLVPKKSACVVSLYKRVTEYEHFEVLINIEESASLSWEPRDKYSLNPQGSVEGGEKFFIARRPAKNHNKEGSLTHFLGKFNPNENLGVFTLVDQNKKELQFEDGELLVEKEPIRYEFKNIKFDKFKSRHSRRSVILGEATLKNEEEGTQRVDSVISYNYTFSVFWGKGHGILTGLPFTVSFVNGTQTKGVWAMPDTSEKVEVAQIEKYLDQGTAVNVTLRGNYTESDIPYVTTVSSFYKDNQSKERILRDSLRKNYISGLIIDFGPVYFLHNNSHVPTTTTTSTTTITPTTTTRMTTTIPAKVTTIDPPDIDQVTDNKIPNTSEGKRHEHNVPGDDGAAQQLKKKGDNSSSSPSYCNLILLLCVIMVKIVT